MRALESLMGELVFPHDNGELVSLTTATPINDIDFEMKKLSLDDEWLRCD